MAFKYRERSSAAWEKRATQSNDWAGIFNSDYKEYQVRKGDNYVRILPPTWDGAEHYGLDVFVHYGIGPDRATVLCLFKMADAAKHFGKDDFAHGRCPICEAKAKADRAGDKELGDELRYTKRVAVWMLDLKEIEAGPQIWSMPQGLDVSICKLARDPRSGATYVLDHPEEGYGISFEKEGEGMKTKYVVPQIDRTPSSVNIDFLDFVEATPLPDQLIWRSYEEVQKLYAGAEPGGSQARSNARDDRGTASAGRNSAEPPRRDPPQERPREAEQGPGLRQRGAPPRESEDESLRRDQEALRDPPRRDDPPKREDPPFEPDPARASAASSAKSKAEELRERFKRK